MLVDPKETILAEELVLEGGTADISVASGFETSMLFADLCLGPYEHDAYGRDGRIPEEMRALSVEVSIKDGRTFTLGDPSTLGRGDKGLFFCWAVVSGGGNLKYNGVRLRGPRGTVVPGIIWLETDKK